jgi:hypothetical protein
VSNDRLNVKVVSNQNSVELTKSENKVVVTDKKQDTTVNVVQKETNVVSVISKGPKGDRGERGEQASLSGSVYITGSLEVSSSVTAQSFTGSLFGTASWAESALTASYVDAQNIAGLSLSRISTGSITASVNIGSDTFRVQSGSSTYFFISSSGRVGIGTTTPNLGLLQLSSTTDNPHANLVVNASNGGTGSITVRANNGFTGNQKTYNPIGGSDSLNFIQLLDTDTTTAANQPIGRIIFTSNDIDTNEFTTKAFIEAVAEDITPDSFLAFGTNQSGSNTTERMRITSTGNVGIGTTTPTNTLQVAGGITTTFLTASIISASNGITGSLFGTASWAVNALTSSFITPTGTNAFVQGGNSFGTTALLGTNDNQNLQLETSGSVRMTISSSGNVGIGTTSPTAKLHVSGNIYTEDNVIIPSGKDILIRDVVDDTTGTILRGTYDSTGTDPEFDIISTASIFAPGLTNTRIDLFATNTTYIGGLPNFGRILFTIPNSGNITFGSPSNANTLFVSGSGRVGIGTISPSQKLEVRDGFIIVSGSGASGYGYLLNRVGQDAYSIRHLDGGLTINNETDNVKEMTFLGNGNIGINENNPSARLEIKGSGTTSATTALRVENSSATTSLVVRDDGNVGIGTTTPASILHISGASAIMTLSPIDPLPTTNVPSASFATSGSGADLKPYFWNGSTWTALF